MYDILACNISTECLQRFWLFHQKNIMGAISFYPHKASSESAIMDVFIEEQYRKRWLQKNFAKKIVDVIGNNLRQKNISLIYTQALVEQSPPLLAFFGFKRYNGFNYVLIL